MCDLQLVEDYFFIIEHFPDPDEAFKDSLMEKEFAWAWLFKLCTEIYHRKEDKQLRNLYLIELSKCITQGKLKEPFMSLPPKGKLQNLESYLKINIDPKTVIDEMQANAAQLIPQIHPKNYQTHMRTKIFDNNQGACAYLAVSLGDPKNGPIWMEMGGNVPFIQTTNINEELLGDCSSSGCESLDDEASVDFIEFCLEKTAQEIAGQAEPGDCPLLESHLDLYANFIEDYDIGKEARNLNKSEFRTFLLINFQTDLVHALERQQKMKKAKCRD